jgi:hypothetical protein
LPDDTCCSSTDWRVEGKILICGVIDPNISFAPKLPSFIFQSNQNKKYHFYPSGASNLLKR